MISNTRLIYRVIGRFHKR